MSDRCHYISDPDAGRVLIPGCMGAAVYGPAGCTCGRRVRPLEEALALETRVADLEREVIRLSALIGSLPSG